MITSSQLELLAAKSGFPVTQDGKIHAMLGISAPSWLVLSWIEDPANIPLVWESKIAESAGDLPVMDSGLTLDAITFSVGTETYTVSGGFTPEEGFVFTGLSLLLLADGEELSEAVVIALDGSIVDESFDYTTDRPTSEVEDGTRVIVRLSGTLGGVSVYEDSAEVIVVVTGA